MDLFNIYLKFNLPNLTITITETFINYDEICDKYILFGTKWGFMYIDESNEEFEIFMSNPTQCFY